MAGNEDVFQKVMSMGHSAAWDQQWDKAAEAYGKALDEFPDHPKALSSLGLALFELQRYDESLQVYQKAAQAAPTDPVPLEKVGQLSERLGNIQVAIQSFLKAAELYIRNQEADKALSNWVRVTQLDSEHITAHSYLAMVHERLGHAHQAATEYLMVASLLQRSGNADKTAEMIGRALRLDPTSPEVRQAQAMFKSGQLLPKPMRPHGGTGALRMAQVKQLESPKNTVSNLDPIAEARKHALTRLAEILFELSDEMGNPQTPKRGMQSIVHGTGELNLKENDRPKIMLHIGQAIDAQTKDQEAQAAEELERALADGFTDPALYFDLGLLRSKTERRESAIRHLQAAAKHADYALGARLLLAQIQRQAGHLPEAVAEYMEALKVADAMVVPPEQSDELRQLYEPLIEAHAHQTDTVVMEQLCDNVRQLLLRPNWRAEILMAREQLPKSAEGTPPMPLAEILAQAQSSQVIETIGRVHALARAGHLRTAMDEAFESFKYAPTYLPLHILIGDLLVQEGRTQDAIAKYTVVADAYGVRGEAAQAVNLLRRIVQVAPMDLVVRTRLIDQLAERGLVDEAVSEYIDLADIYYRLAELDMARKTYTTALRLAQQGANRAWSVKLMRRMADIDMQRLDWRQAQRIFEQLRTLEPDDVTVRKSLIDLDIRLSQLPQVSAEMDDFLAHLHSSGRRGEAIPFLEELVNEYPRQEILRRSLAEEYRQAGRIPDAAAQLEVVGDLFLNAGDREGAIQIIETIMAMNPPKMEHYRTLLAKIKSEASD
jgi:tetratricopeptide (TPR) repeat protein